MVSTFGSILIYGQYECLLKTRRWMLERAGFRVETSMRLEEALAILTNQPMDLLILCHSLAPEWREAMMATASHCLPEMRLMLLANSNQSYQEHVQKLALSQASLDCVEHPSDLIAAVRRIHFPGSCVSSAA